MAIQGIGPTQGLTDTGALGGAQGAGALGGSGSGSFKDSLTQALQQVSDLQDNAKDAIGAFLRGEPVELHQVMAATEEAGIALDFLIEVRNKVTDAYRSVVNMQM